MTGKILHTSDWHLGKKIFRRSRIGEQKSFLNWLVEIIVKEKIDIVIIAGDIFDTPSPPNSALDLYFNFLEEVSLLKSCHIVIISGNHDSANFIQAPAKILKRHNIHIKTKFSKNLKDNIINLNINDSSIAIKCLPYFRSYELYDFLEKDEVLDSTAVESIMKDFASTWPKETKEESFKIMIGHHAFGDFSATGSEHVINIMGLESLKLNWFQGQFDYIALGHIHKTQKMSKEENIFYSGSPLPLRFSEKQDKHCLLVNISSPTKESVTKIKVPNFKDIITIQGDDLSILETLESTLNVLSSSNSTNAFFEVKLKLPGPNTELTNRLYERIQDCGHELLSLVPEYENQEDFSDKPISINEMNILELFSIYYQEKYPENQDIPEPILKEFSTLIEEIHLDEV